MARLNEVQPDQASGKIEEIYSTLDKKMGKVLNIFKGMANSPATLQAYLDFSQTMAGGELSARDREVIYITVSQANGCSYCLSRHTQTAKKAGLDEDQVIAIRKGESDDAKIQAVIDFTKQVLRTKGFVKDDDLQSLRDLGYTDGQISEIPAMIGMATFSNYFNHIHDPEIDFPLAAEINSDAVAASN